MKKSIWGTLGIMCLLAGFFSFSTIKEGGIQGRVTPMEGVKAVVAISGSDTLSSQLSEGNFVFSNVKKGTYTIWIKANAPYKDAAVENVAVADSATTDVGEIKLMQ